MRKLTGLAAVGAGTAAYALAEPFRYRLVAHDIPVAPTAPALDILHISDTHMKAMDRPLQRFLRSVPGRLDRRPDLVLATGDLIEENSGIDPVVDVLNGFHARLGRFYVLGSHDYYQSKFQAYTKYWTRRGPVKAPRADTARMEGLLQRDGWLPLTNRTEFVDGPDGRIRLSGVDDPYLGWHTTGHIERDAKDVLAIGLMHSPDVVSDYALAGFDLALAGHTHGGQVRVPFVGAVVTNSSLPAELAAGPNRIGDTWLHVSPGLGTGRFAPIRLNCPPEITLLRLRPSSARQTSPLSLRDP